MKTPLITVTEKSGNMKTGPILTTKTERKTCPKSCPLYEHGCYAKIGPLAWHWEAMEKGKNARGFPIETSWKIALQKIAKQKTGSLWRFGEAGDLPGTGEKINLVLLRQLIKANSGKKGFGYTHKYHEGENHKKIKEANREGFTINLSANDPSHADKLFALDIGPVVTLLPSDRLKNLKTPKGRNVIICPAVSREGITCLNCRLCAIPNRKSIIGFPAHGNGKKYVDRLIQMGEKEEC